MKGMFDKKLGGLAPLVGKTSGTLGQMKKVVGTFPFMGGKSPLKDMGGKLKLRAKGGMINKKKSGK